MSELISTFTWVGLIALLAAISPGPDFVLVTRSALLGSKRAAFYTSVGITLGLAVHVAYALVGFTALLQRSFLLYRTIQLLGASYLGYLGIKLLFGKINVSADTKESPTAILSTSQTLFSGFLCNLLNPKASLFILSLFSQVMAAEPSQVWVRGCIGGEILLVTLLWFLLLSTLYTQPSIRQKMLRFQKSLMRVMGCVLLGFCLKIAFFS